MAPPRSLALAAPKGAGRDQAVVFEEAMQLAASDRLVLRSELDAGLATGQFALLYQPIVDLTDLRIEGVEALIRWNHPTLGVLEPSSFISMAERTDVIVALDTWVMTETCRQGRLWLDDGLPPLRLS